MRVNVRTAKKDFCKLIRLAESGRNVVVTRRGVPVIRLHSFSAAQRARESRQQPDLLTQVLAEADRLADNLGLNTNTAERRKRHAKQP